MTKPKIKPVFCWQLTWWHRGFKPRSRRLATYTLPTVLCPNNTPTMDPKVLEAEKTLRSEHANLRTLISLSHSMCIGGYHQNISLEVIRTSFARLADIDSQLLSHLLAKGIDTEQELAKVIEYADKVANILASHPESEPPTKSNTSSKFPEAKLPPIVAKDPASWIKFKTLLDIVPGAKTATGDEKKAKLIAALPPTLAIDVRHLSYAEAVQKLDVEFESEENLRTTIRELFRNLPKVKNLDDQAGMKGVQDRKSVV